MFQSIALAAALAAVTPQSANRVGSSGAPTPAQITDVIQRLSPIEQSPNYDVIRGLTYARPAFEAIARDNSIPRVLRGRALEGIASYRDDSAFARVVGAVDDGTLPLVIRQTALVALGTYFQTRALPVVERVLLGGEELQLRRSAAMTLSRVHAPEAIDLAKQAQVVEQNEVVRGDLAASVRSLTTPPRRPMKVR